MSPSSSPHLELMNWPWVYTNTILTNACSLVPRCYVSSTSATGLSPRKGDYLFVVGFVSPKIPRMGSLLESIGRDSSKRKSSIPEFLSSPRATACGTMGQVALYNSAKWTACQGGPINSLCCSTCRDPLRPAHFTEPLRCTKRLYLVRLAEAPSFQKGALESSLTS